MYKTTLAKLPWIGVALVAASTAARADFTNPQTPVWRGDPQTEFSGYEKFTQAVAMPNFPDDPNSTSDDQSLTQLNPGAVITTTCNIYNPASASSFVLEDFLAGRPDTVWLQVSTLGSELDYPATRLNYIDDQGNPVSLPATMYTELARTAGQGFAVESLWEWDLPHLGFATDFTITFDAVTSNLSLDAILVDTRYTTPFEIYCTAKSGLVCGTPEIGTTGYASATDSAGFELNASPALGQRTGILLYTDGGKGAFPFQGGVLCLFAPLYRTAPGTSGGINGNCDGVYTLDMNAFARGLLGGNPQPFLDMPGERVFAQWWGRDSIATGSFLSNAIHYEVGL